jgi:HAMP domain-containing protein
MWDTETISAIAGILGAACVLALIIAGVCALVLAGVNERSTERLERKLLERQEDGDQ